MVKQLLSGARDERGFTLIELFIYIAILAVILGTAIIAYVNMMDVSQVNGAADQVRTALENAMDMASSMNEKVTVNFYNNNTGPHPNTYTITIEVGEEGSTTKVSVSEPPPGVSHFPEEGGVYYIKLLDGQPDLTIAGNTTVTYEPDGVLMNITVENSAEAPEDEIVGSVRVASGSKTRTIYVSSLGKVTY